MKPCFAYIRVSTNKQGEGVSLDAQRDAITRYAQRNALEVRAWFKEKETAAKRGRPVFGEMIRRLRKGEVQGLLIHKIDRGARNLKDWADLGELIDSGVDVRFANEGLDLKSRGGRLSADIQAVVAADFIRNLREETRKGFYGRLKQGLYPLPAPLGYLDQGKGKPKIPDPDRAPLVREAFKLYSDGGHSLHTLLVELRRLGLQSRRGGELTRTGLSILLNNPFYVGLIRLRRTGETFRGVHEPLISTALFDRVGDILHGRTTKRGARHDFLFQRLLSCRHCGYSLTGERQKGHVYYRCHTKACLTTTVREEVVDETVRGLLLPLRLNSHEQTWARAHVARFREQWAREREDLLRTLRLRAAQLETRLDRLTDAYVDELLERSLFEGRKEKLLVERQELVERIRDLESGETRTPDRLAEFLELAESVSLRYEMSETYEKRDLIRIVTSNREVAGREPVFTLSEPFHLLANRPKPTNSTPYRDGPRTWQRIVEQLLKHLTKQEIRL